ncbi:MAG: hypothetical protein QNJ98_15230 [Planctomycetota bacterium]|nr:hypothetical protein [Planctomycetota bacterium]
MRHPAPILLAVLAAFLIGCSSDDAGPAGANGDVATFGPGSQGTATAARPMPAPAPAMQTFTWHSRLADAQAEARRTGRLILCLSTKPGCTLCDKFKDEILPQTRGQVAPVAVGYIYDIRRPEVPQVDQTLRANLKGASLMPLVGFLTPELRWVHGFWGPTDARKFGGDIQTARSIYPVRTAAIVPTNTVDTSGMTAVINEFGEREWSLPGDVWPTNAPEPEDAITGRPLPAGAPAALTAPLPANTPVLADTGPAPTPAPTPTPAPAPAPAPAPVADPVQLPPLVAPSGPVAPEPTPAPVAAPTPTAPVAPATPAANAGTEAWGRETLDRALQQIQIGDYDGARRTLAEIGQRMPGSAIAREAAKGNVAIYNHKKARSASGVERDRVMARAQRDLGRTMWGVLFTS